MRRNPALPLSLFARFASTVILLGAAPLFALSAAASPEEDEGSASSLPPVRVRLASLGSPRTIKVQGTGPLRVVDIASGAALAVRTPSITLTAEGTEICVEDAVAETTDAASNDRRGKTVRIEGALLLVGAGRSQRMYPGALEATAAGGRLTIRNECALEDYTVGVLSGECPALFHPQAIRAMAVAARSYSYRRAYLSGRELCDTTHCQVYRGIGTARAAHREAVRDTEGLCALYGGEVIDAVYSSDCGGRTEASEDAWRGGKAIPYLRSVEDAPAGGGAPFCAASRAHTWSLALARPRLQALLGAADGPLKLAVTDTTPSGRVRRLILSRLAQSADAAGGAAAATAAMLSREYTGEQWRSKLGAAAVKSLKFEVRETAAGVELDGAGFGHGVGLCQYGANEMGRRGVRFTDILKHYYTGVTIEAAPPADAAQARQPAGKRSRRASS